jgi:cytochrome c553
LHRISIQPITHPCPRWLRGAANPRCEPAAPATAPKVPGALKTPVWPGCLPLTSSSRSSTKNEEEIKAAAAYFSALKPKAVITVVETETVPKTFIARVFVAKLPGNETEPLGKRIVEVPVDMEQFEHRDTRAKFVVYVPPGTLARGEALVKTGGSGTTLACATCHGADLKGLADLPSIAGRSPSYVVRQLYDMQQGTRAGAMSALMKPVVEKLTGDDMNAIAAYLATQQP